MNKEEVFLNIISKTLGDSSFLGDDCAYLKEYNLAVSSDTLVEDVHFRLKPNVGAISPYSLGKKALLVNISDILAAGAKPEYLTVSLSGNLNTDFIEEFYKGINDTCEKHNLKVIGGDLTGGEKISISITIFGNTKNRTVSSRAAAKEGYVVLLAGEHGSSAVGLSILNTAGCDTFLTKETFKNDFIKAHIEPELYPKISEIISTKAKHPYAMMDTSDGLYDAMKKISLASNVGFNVDYDKIPKKCVTLNDDTIVPDFNTVLFGGEDYGLLICVHNEDFKIFGAEIKSLGAVEMGTVTKTQEKAQENKILINNKEINKDLRFEHFE